MELIIIAIAAAFGGFMFVVTLPIRIALAQMEVEP